jgi:hypothetical protein
MLFADGKRDVAPMSAETLIEMKNLRRKRD